MIVIDMIAKLEYELPENATKMKCYIIGNDMN